LQAAADGSAITYQTSTPTEPEPQGYAAGMRVFSSRGPSGWSSLDIGIPYKEALQITVGEGEEYKSFSSDLTHGLVEPVGGFDALSSEATERTPYLRSDYANEDTRELCVSACFRPLVTTSNVPPGTVFGGSAQEIFPPAKFVTATPDLSHVLLHSNVALTSTPTKAGFYEWSKGQLQLVSELPESEGGGSAQGLVTAPSGPGETMHSISSDGRRVFWSGIAALAPRNGLYMRDTIAHETVRLDVVEGSQTNAKPLAPQFRTASSDGSHAFFTDAERLTEDSTADDGSTSNEGQSDLYAYDLNAPAGKKLTDLTVDQNSGEAADVQGVLGASEDGSYVYFVANGALAPGAAPGKCRTEQSPPDTTCNLYVAHNSGGGWERPKLITVLSGEDQPDWNQGLRTLTARVSPSGRYLAFMSDRRVTGYDNRDAVSGKPDEEVYLYDANIDKSVCASCNLTGARPSGVEFGTGRLVRNARIWDKTRWLAANVPGWTGYGLTQAQYQSRYLSDSGRLFFDASDALVPQDVNNTEDVYEYEPSGVGGCAISAGTFDAKSGGCVSLISAGTSPRESAFLDASETGGDAFFMTNASLSPRDFDTSFDIYDARKCEGEGPCALPVLPPPCSTGDSCKAAPSPQPTGLGAPSSATFSGAGNVLAQAPSSKVSPKALSRAQKLTRALRACEKKRLRKARAACRRLAKKRYGKARAKKSNRSVVGHGSSAGSGRGGKR
jgi:hypothetical protein